MRGVLKKGFDSSGMKVVKRVI